MNKDYMSDPLVTCGICNKPVDKASFSRNEITRTLVITACCHGATDIIEVPDKFIESGGAKDTLNIAFNPSLETKVCKPSLPFNWPRTERPEDEVKRDAMAFLKALMG